MPSKKKKVRVDRGDDDVAAAGRGWSDAVCARKRLEAFATTTSSELPRGGASSWLVGRREARAGAGAREPSALR
jgi:hypothetical protein